MNVTVAIPDDLAHRLSADGADAARRVLESFAVEEYRGGRLSDPDLGRLLGFATRGELDGFLKDRAIYQDYDEEDLERDQCDLRRAGFD